MVYPSRQALPEYLAYANEIEQVVERVNDRWATRDWLPIVFDERDDFARSVAGMQRYDVLFVNPLKDGLNLVAKEGPLLNRRDGVLCLSREAGAYDELHDGVLALHPFDIEQMAGALDDALATPDGRSARRCGPLRELVLQRTPASWLADLRRARGLSRSAACRRSATAASRRDQPVRSVDERVDRAASSGGASGDSTPIRTAALEPPVVDRPLERGERGEVAGVVARERADREPVDQRVDRRALVDRDGRPQLDGLAAAQRASARAGRRGPPRTRSPRRARSSQCR